MTPPAEAPREAGRELDAEVAEKVMGWTVKRVTYGSTEHWFAGPWCDDRQGPGDYQFWRSDGVPGAFGFFGWWRPSQDIGAAWQVVEKLRALGYEVTIGCPPFHGPCYCEIAKPSDRGSDVEYGDTAPEAICLAALAAVSTKEPSHV